MKSTQNLAHAITIMLKNFERETGQRINTIRIKKENKQIKNVQIKLIKLDKTVYP